MRFVIDGPQISDSLLNARDEGRVVFFCGAGVSRAAGLPDFFGLAESVLQDLGVDDNHDAKKVLDEARNVGERLNISGLISADRIFGLLERDFTVEFVQGAVARCLKPPEGADISAHKTLIKLSTTPESRLQLVTTNFDRLFECTGIECKSFQPPRLPKLVQSNDLNGLVYLHGRVDQEYNGPDGEGLIVSSGDFGHAYLSEGWAAEFFREIVRKYVVVFVGYSADDPPASYLLEGLRRRGNAKQPIFAFQSNEKDELVARWEQKGVTAIPYDPENYHQALWSTLAGWAERSEDPASWRSNVLNRAINGPEKMSPIERGQVAHIVSTQDGAREFLELAPPATWLCVFDPSCRYAKPDRVNRYDFDGPYIDPFEQFGLDSDPLPKQVKPDDPYSNREIPDEVWDAFQWNRRDILDVSQDNLSSFRGTGATTVPRVAKRIDSLGFWISKVAHQAPALWWAVRQSALHSRLLESLRWRLERGGEAIAPNLRREWQYLLDHFERPREPAHGEFFDLKRDVDNFGWNQRIVRELVEWQKPRVVVESALMASNLPPPDEIKTNQWELIRPQVKCNPIPDQLVCPDEWLSVLLTGMRNNIGLAVQLSEEVSDYSKDHICPIIPDDSPGISSHGRTEGISGCVVQFAGLFERLAKLHPQIAEQEYSCWADDDSAFTRLRVWATGKIDLFSVDDFVNAISATSDQAFWDSHHARDFLLSLKNRWNQLDAGSRHRIETRILSGPEKFDGEDDESFDERKSWSILNRVEWLRRNDCEFGSDLDSIVPAHRESAPKWQPNYSNHAAESREARAGFVRTNTEHADLLTVPIDEILAKASESTGQSGFSEFEEYKPFAGLCSSRPRRAYLALARQERKGEFQTWAWKTFLSPETRKDDVARLVAVLASRICKLSNGNVASILYEVSMWFERVSKRISSERPDLFENVAAKLVSVLEQKAGSGSTIVLSSSRGRDFVTEAINSSSGHVAMAVLQDTRLDDLEDDGLATNDFTLPLLQRLLDLDEKSRCHVIVIVCRSLIWFFRVAKDWTKERLLTLRDTDSTSDDKDAFWAGFLWHPKIGTELFLILKPRILDLAKTRATNSRSDTQSLACIVLSAWYWSSGGDEAEVLENSEFRDVLLQSDDEFRSQVIWQLERGFDGDQSEAEQLGFAKQFFESVWPKQKSVRTHSMTRQLCRILFVNARVFGHLMDPVRSFLTRLPDGHYADLDVHDGLPEISQQYPLELADVLLKVLPNSISDWPYGIGNVLENISKSVADVSWNQQLRELLLRWQSR